MQFRTEEEFDRIISECREIFQKKSKDYSHAWLLYRPSSLTDKIFLKARRIRTIEEKRTTRIQEGIESEYIGIINYCIMALVKLWHGDGLPQEDDMFHKDEPIDHQKVLAFYDKVVSRTRQLLLDKNHDYEDAWKELRVSSIIDEILVKLYRIREIDKPGKKPLASEGIDSQYSDIIIYSVFSITHIRHPEILESPE